MDSFTDKPLLALQEISARHRPIAKQDLERLKQQIDVALGIPEEEMRQCTYSEMIQGIAKYGHGSVCIGDFVIRRR